MIKRFLLALIIVAGLVIESFAAQFGPPPGEFDYYVFSLSWQPFFCETHQNKKECKTWKEGDFDTKNLVLHGLWPSRFKDKKHSYDYCDVPDKTKRMDNASNWCRMGMPDLSQSTIDKLREVMPGYQSCLENHEWYTHGVCSGMEADMYFATAARFVKNVAGSELGTFLSSNVGKEVDFNDLVTAARQDYGDKAVTIRYICKHGMLSEVRMYLKKDLPEKEGISAELLLSPDASEKSTCPHTIRIDKFGKTDDE
jgi:ribonuclease T2